MMTRTMLWLGVAVAVVGIVSTDTVRADWIDFDTFAGQGEASFNDQLADTNSRETLELTPASLHEHSLSVGSSSGSVALEYALKDTSTEPGGSIAMETASIGSGDDLTNANTSLALTFTTTRALFYQFDAQTHLVPQVGFSAGLNDLNIEGYHDPLAENLVGGNFFTNDWPAVGILPAGDHTFSFGFDGAGYRGDAWNYSAGATLKLQAVPEPGSLALLTCFALGVLQRRRRG